MFVQSIYKHWHLYTGKYRKEIIETFDHPTKDNEKECKKRLQYYRETYPGECFGTYYGYEEINCPEY